MITKLAESWGRNFGVLDKKELTEANVGYEFGSAVRMSLWMPVCHPGGLGSSSSALLIQLPTSVFVGGGSGWPEY